jgi:hypothetical protein
MELSKMAKNQSEIRVDVEELEKLSEKVDRIYSDSGSENPEGLTEEEFESLHTVVSRINAWLQE